MLDENLLNALKLSFSSSVQRIAVPSIGDAKRLYSFREPTVREVNTISKVLLSNSDSPSTVYASTLVFIKYLCMDEDFNPYEMNEIDRLKLITYILSGIFFSKNLTIKCPRTGCNTSFPYALKYGDILKKIDEVSSKEFVFENKTDAGNVKLTACFPTTRRYLEFLEYVDGIHNKPVDYKNFNDSFVEIDSTRDNSDTAKATENDGDRSFIEKIKKRREILKGKISKSKSDGNTVAGNVDIRKTEDNGKMENVFSYMYIKNMLITDIPGSEDDFNLDFSGLTYEDSLKLLDVIPMKVLVMDDGENFIDFISRKVEYTMNKCAPELKCPSCGHNAAKNLGVESFFIHG